MRIMNKKERGIFLCVFLCSCIFCCAPEMLSQGARCSWLNKILLSYPSKGDLGRGGIISAAGPTPACVCVCRAAKKLLTFPQTLDPISHDQTVVFLVVDAPRRESLDWIHRVCDTVKPPAQSGLQGRAWRCHDRWSSRCNSTIPNPTDVSRLELALSFETLAYPVARRSL